MQSNWSVSVLLKILECKVIGRFLYYERFFNAKQLVGYCIIKDSLMQSNRSVIVLLKII